MSDMKCPRRGEELVDQGAKIGNKDRVFACENINCTYYGQNLDLEIWQESTGRVERNCQFMQIYAHKRARMRNNTQQRSRQAPARARGEGGGTA